MLVLKKHPVPTHPVLIFRKRVLQAPQRLLLLLLIIAKPGTSSGADMNKHVQILHVQHYHIQYYHIQYLTSLDRIGSWLWIRQLCYDLAMTKKKKYKLKCIINMYYYHVCLCTIIISESNQNYRRCLLLLPMKHPSWLLVVVI